MKRKKVKRSLARGSLSLALALVYLSLARLAVSPVSSRYSTRHPVDMSTSPPRPEGDEGMRLLLRATASFRELYAHCQDAGTADSCRELAVTMRSWSSDFEALASRLQRDGAKQHGLAMSPSLEARHTNASPPRTLEHTPRQAHRPSAPDALPTPRDLFQSPMTTPATTSSPWSPLWLWASACRCHGTRSR